MLFSAAKRPSGTSASPGLQDGAVDLRPKRLSTRQRKLRSVQYLTNRKAHNTRNAKMLTYIRQLAGYRIKCRSGVYSFPRPYLSEAQGGTVAFLTSHTALTTTTRHRPQKHTSRSEFHLKPATALHHLVRGIDNSIHRQFCIITQFNSDHGHSLRRQ